MIRFFTVIGLAHSQGPLSPQATERAVSAALYPTRYRGVQATPKLGPRTVSAAGAMTQRSVTSLEHR